MKIEYRDKLIIYLTNRYLNNKNIEISNIENCLKDICYSINKNYHIKLNGLYNIEVYIDKSYGIVLEIEKQEDFGYYIDQVDMEIVVHYNKFLLKTNNLEPFYNHIIYLYKNNYYTDNLDKIEMGKLIYKTDNILKKAKAIEI